MGIEDVEVVQPRAFQTLVGTSDDALPGAPLAVWSRPHVIPGLAGDDHLIAVRVHATGHHPTEVLLGATGNRPVVVGQVIVGDAQIKGLVDDGLLRAKGVHATKVVPQSQPNR